METTFSTKITVSKSKMNSDSTITAQKSPTMTSNKRSRKHSVGESPSLTAMPPPLDLENDTKESKEFLEVTKGVLEATKEVKEAAKGLKEATKEVKEVTKEMKEVVKASKESASKELKEVKEPKEEKVAKEESKEEPQKPEPLLTATDERFVIFPLKHTDIWQKYKHHVAVFWTSEEIDLSKDMKDWEKLNDNERHFIKHILGFFAGSDGIVMENLATRFMREIQVPEAKFFYACQNLMEAIHSETYSLLIDTYIQDKQEKSDILRAIQTIPCVKKKAEWALAWIENDEADFATRLLGFAAVEGIFFSGAFCAIFWLKQRGVMPGLTLSNEFIARDEGLHTEFACLLYNKIQNRLSKQKAVKIIREAVKIEKHFITKALPCELIGMNAKLMGQYIEFVADRLLLQLGYPKAYNSTNPFSFMENMSLENKDNFFEKRVSTYAKAAVGKKAEDMKFKMTEDF
jgi:ribonucleoside-diphosphate reductase beta chain